MEFKSLVPFGRSVGLSRAETDVDPFRAFRREIDRLFHDFDRGWGLPAAFAGNRNGLLTPRVNVAETEKGLEVTAD